jgi:6-phosphofructokinase 1
VVENIEERDENGRPFTVVVVTEGAKEKGGATVVDRIVDDSPDPVRYGGIGAKLARDLEPMVGHECRSVSLGHIQRGGETSAADRVLSIRYGVKAAHMIAEEQYGCMVCLRGGKMEFESLEKVIGTNKLVDPYGEMVNVARSLGISFGA